MREPVVVTRPAHFTVDDDVTSMGKTAASAIRAIRVVAPIVVMLANQLAILQRPRRPNAFDEAKGCLGLLKSHRGSA